MKPLGPCFTIFTQKVPETEHDVTHGHDMGVGCDPTWGVTLVTVALHGGVPLLLEGPVHAAPVLKSVLGKSVF